MKEQIGAVQRMQDYIEAHLNENITLAQLSSVSHFSAWYSYRLFREYTNMTPADYIRRLRLSKSAIRLKKEQCRVMDVAYDLGYGSVDGYQRAFFREFGCNPHEYVQNPIPLYLFIPYGVKYREIKNKFIGVEQEKEVVLQMIERPARKVMIKRGVKAKDYFEYCQEVDCGVWGLLTSMNSLFGEPVCLWLPEQYRTLESSVYVQGIEVAIDYEGEIPEGFDIITLPAATYLMFRGEPFKEENYCQAIYDVQKYIEKYDPLQIGYRWDDDNPSIQLEPIGRRGYIQMKAIKACVE